MSRYTQEQKQQIAKRVQNKWLDPEYRAKMVAKQKALGYRSYAR